jgi:hypothetical protein
LRKHAKNLRKCDKNCESTPKVNCAQFSKKKSASIRVVLELSEVCKMQNIPKECKRVQKGAKEYK